MNTNIGNEGVIALGKMLEMNKTLEQLDLMKNPIEAGAADLFSSLVKNNTLKKFRVGVDFLTERAGLAWDTLDIEGKIEQMMIAQNQPDLARVNCKRTKWSRWRKI